MRTKIGESPIRLMFLAIALAALSSTASAQVKPGDFITPDNASKVAVPIW